LLLLLLLPQYNGPQMYQLSSLIGRERHAGGRFPGRDFHGRLTMLLCEN
jgi:hypothetical protein